MDVLRPTALEQIYAHASRSYPEECCGFVFADGSVYLGSNIQNELHHKNPEMYPRSAANGYTFSVADTLLMNKAFRSDNPVVVIYHSHPDVGAYFSDEDQDKALFLGEPIYPVSYLVVDVCQGQALGSKLFAWDGKHFALQPFNDLHTELSMNAVSFPDILVRVAKLPEATLEGTGSTLREVIENLCSSHPQLRTHLFHEKNNQLKEHFLFTAEEELIGADEQLPEKAKIEVLLATSGGMDVDQLSNEEVQRYVRHITLPGVGREGQLNLKKAKVLIIGTGGLGSPISLYLAAAGIGTLGLVDFDVVESSNLQRQIVHGNSTLGMPKVESAKRRLQDLNSHIQINAHDTALNADNALELVGAYDLVIDGTDNFDTRYLVNDACVQLSKPLVYGAIYRFDGQISVLNYKGGPCYRCLFPSAPPAELAPNCSAGGVIGPARVLVLGLGVAGLEAIATAHRLGALVEGYDVRAQTREQALSLGATFVDTGIDASGAGGYARELSVIEQTQVAKVLTAHLQKADLVITTAAVPGRASPKLISKAQLAGMKCGAVIVDLAAEGGGNCEDTVPGDTLRVGGVTVVAPLNVPSLLSQDASQLLAHNQFNLLALMLKDNIISCDWTDEVLAKTALTHDGHLMEEASKSSDNKPPQPTTPNPSSMA